MVSAVICVEGGGNSKELHARCREGFRKLLESCGYQGRLPKIIACGSRGATFDGFKREFHRSKYDFVAILVDSEDKIKDLDKTWEHLRQRPDDSWRRPDSARNEQVLLMTTCMETWIAADRAALKNHYGACLQEGSLPAVFNLEKRNRRDIQNDLTHATRNCPNKYEKGKRSFKVLGLLDPAELEKHLPSFARMKQILDAELR